MAKKAPAAASKAASFTSAAHAKPGKPDSAAVKRVFELMQEHSVELVDLRFTDPKGKWHHTTQWHTTIEEDTFVEGFMFDGSSIAGWKAINESDMVLLPDPTTAVMDPFSAKPQLILICDIVEPRTGTYYARDPRSTAKLPKPI